jgi:raffinose/stachyose/melibiose transport system permease protein
LTPLFFVAPAFLIYTVFIVYPMVDSLIVSFNKWDGVSPQKEFIGLHNYAEFFQDQHSLEVLGRTLQWTIGAVVVPTLLGLGFAVVLNRRLPGRSVFRGVFYLSYTMPLVALGVMWSWIYNPQFGALNALLRAVGLGKFEAGWLSAPQSALWSVMATNVWYASGFPMVLFLAGLQTIPQELYEAAWIDGARPAQSFLHITIPSLRETFVVVIALLIINSLKAFDLIYVMTWGGPGRSTQVLGVWMYFNTFLFDKAGFGSAIAWIMTIVSLAIAIPYIQVLTREHA